jgi:hypothetical protein
MASKTQQLVEDLKSLIKREARIKAGLPSPAERDDIPASRGVGLATVTNKKSSSSGIASPLTEQADKRTTYPERYITSTDGLFTLAWSPVLQATYTDANGAEVVVNYADPDA